MTATEQTDVGRQAVAAVPLIRGEGKRRASAASRSSPTRSTTSQANVELIRGRILAAGALALVLAAIAGYLVARALTARIKRLEQAARKVAAGDFSNPIHADSDDELGQLATAFDDMQRQLARLDTARKQFIASASHELRTPIFSLGGFLELLEDEELDEETRAQFLAQLRGQVDAACASSPPSCSTSRGWSPARWSCGPSRPTSASSRATSSASSPPPRTRPRRRRSQLRTAPEPIEIECDPERVAQVMRILLDNALVHTPAGHGHRGFGRARRRACHPGGRRLRPRHPPPDHAAHLRALLHLSADGARGAGLGLAIARELAERMQGEPDRALRARARPRSS